MCQNSENIVSAFAKHQNVIISDHIKNNLYGQGAVHDMIPQGEQVKV